MNRRTILMAVIWGLAGMLGCDNENNIDLPSDSYFLKFFGRDGDQEGVDLVVAPDGTILMFGTSTLPNGLTQWYLVNADANGNLLWERTYGDPNKNDEARDIELTTDGRIVLAGNEENSPGERDVFVMTLTLAGVPIDSARVNQIQDSFGKNNDEDVNSVTEVGGQFIISGSTTTINIKPGGAGGAGDLRDALLIRFDNRLQLVEPSFLGGTWRVTAGFDSDDVAVKVYPSTTVVGNLYLFGFTNSLVPGLINGQPDGNSDYNFWVMHIGDDGEEDGGRMYFGTTSRDEFLGSVCIGSSQDGIGFLLTGISSAGQGSELYLAGLRDNINFNGSDFAVDGKPVLSVGPVLNLRTNAAVAVAGGYLIAASNNLGGSENIQLARVDANLAPQWQSPLQFGGSNDDSVGNVAELPDGRILIVGTMRVGDIPGEKKMVLMKLNQEGRFAK